LVLVLVLDLCQKVKVLGRFPKNRVRAIPSLAAPKKCKDFILTPVFGIRILTKIRKKD
jgi:hypothetical protein